MSEVPGETPVTKPVTASTVATPGVALLQLPPPVVLVQMAVAPTHKGVVPIIV